VLFRSQTTNNRSKLDTNQLWNRPESTFKMANLFLSLFVCFASTTAHAFTRQFQNLKVTKSVLHAATDSGNPKSDNKAMSFLRKIGKVGTVTDFKHIMGVDEGPAGKSGGAKPLVKSRSSYKSCVESGVIDDMSESFPLTSAGTTWTGFTDRVMGGMSSGSVTRETNVDGKVANVLRGTVSLANNGGFVQMATDLANDPSICRTVDASEYDGIELDIKFEGTPEKDFFNVHLKNAACSLQFSSYRGTFEISRGTWQTVRLPWSIFQGYGAGTEGVEFDPSSLRRLGVVAIGRAMEVNLALGGVRFYSVF